MSLEEECEYPALADRKIMDAFREIKEFLRRFDRCGLVDKHGAEYGFARNLSGARMVFVVQAIGGIVICGFKGRLHWTFTSGCGINLTLLALWIPFAWLILPRMLMLSAEAYAGRAWITFLSLAERSYKKPSSAVSPETNYRCASRE
jgi:hypothetical protein